MSELLLGAVGLAALLGTEGAGDSTPSSGVDSVSAGSSWPSPSPLACSLEVSGAAGTSETESSRSALENESPPQPANATRNNAEHEEILSFMLVA
jgi:hypothetical protein